MHLRSKQDANGDFLTIQQTATLLNLGTTTVRSLAERAGAVCRIGRCYRINRKKIVDYINRECAVER